MPLKSWLSVPASSQFSLANIPFGIITHATGTTPRPAIAIGDHALDLHIFTTENGFRDLSTIQPHSTVFSSSTLNAFAALGQPIHAVVRKYLQSVLLEDTPYPEVLKNNPSLQEQCLVLRKDCQLHLPLQIGDYSDFFVGLHHAYNAGSLFRGPANALNANYKHLPVGYHGRASSIVVSGTPVRRPRGQILLKDASAEIKQPEWAACEKLDFELEFAAFVCKGNSMGEPIAIAEAQRHIFGFVLMNDWSARDVQAWEYVPLGPFTAKNFATSISGWVVLPDALEPFRCASLENEVEVLEYLREDTKDNVYDIRLSVDLTTAKGDTTTICRTSSKNLLFSFPQMLAHHTVTGCPMAVGDLIGSGTISGTDKDGLGALLEQSKGGKEAIKLEGGEERTFLRDGDSVTFHGVCGGEGGFVGFGELEGTVLPAHK